MTIYLEDLNGKQYRNFMAATVELRLDALCNTFSFQIATKDNQPLPFRGNEPCRVVVDGELALTGNIEIVDASYSARQHNITVYGRDKTGDLLDSTIGPISDLRPPISLKAIVERVISEIGLTGVEVVDEANAPVFNKAEDLVSPEPGENAFEFLEKFARKRQVILSSNKDGNILLTTATPKRAQSFIRNVIGGTQNNVKSGTVSYDTTGRFNVYKFVSSLNPIALNAAGSVGLKDVVDQSGQQIDTEIRKGRQMVLVSESPFSSSQNSDRAKWEANIRKSRGRAYSATVQGFRNENGDLWAINTLASVNDEFAGISANMLINTIGFSYSLSGGSETTLGFIDENAYTLTLDEPQRQNIGSGLFS